MDPDFGAWINFASVSGDALEVVPVSVGGILLDIFWLLFLTFVFAIFTCGETSLYFANFSSVKSMEESGGVKRASKALEKHDLYNITFKLGRIVCVILSFTVFFREFAPVFMKIPFLDVFSNGIKSGIIYAFLLIVFTILTTLLGQVLPCKITLRDPENILVKLSFILMIFSIPFLPLSMPVKIFGDAIAKLLKIDENSKGQKVTPETILMLVDEGKEKGDIEEGQQDMISRIFEFDETTAEDMMTHRTDIVGLPVDSSISEVVAFAVEHGYSRIPVYKEDFDDIIGVVYMKDLLKYIDKTKTNAIRASECMRPALYVPESNSAKEIFKEFTDKKVQLAVVVDEYGGTSGIVTMEDLLEAIVGNIQDEYDNEIEEIEKIDDKTFLIEGTAEIEDVSEKLGVKLPDDSDYYDTIAGLITDILGRIPDKNEKPDLIVGEVKFTVLEVSDRRISKIRAEILNTDDSGIKEKDSD